MKTLSTSDLARATGIHPNTVRRYVDWGLLPPVERSPAGYRRFTQRHLDCLRLVCLVFYNQYPSVGLRQSALRIVHAAVAGEMAGALALAREHLAFILSERAQADLAAALLERWAAGPPAGAPLAQPLTIGQVAKLLGVTIDILRNWDRNGLIDIPRDPHNGYRRYGAGEISRLRVIRVLSRSGFSLAAILRMMVRLDRGERSGLRAALDTPRPDEDVFTAADRWITTLTEQEKRARAVIVLLEEILQRSSPINPSP